MSLCTSPCHCRIWCSHMYTRHIFLVYIIRCPLLQRVDRKYMNPCQCHRAQNKIAQSLKFRIALRTVRTRSTKFDVLILVPSSTMPLEGRFLGVLRRWCQREESSGAAGAPAAKNCSADAPSAGKALKTQTCTILQYEYLLIKRIPL